MLRSDAPAYPGLKRDRNWGGAWVYRGQRLPAALVSYRAARHTWEHLVEDLLNGRPLVPQTHQARRRPDLHPYQGPRVEEIGAAHGDSAPGYLLVAPTGSGKTLISVEGLSDRPVEVILVITKRGIIPAWLRTIEEFSAGRRWVVMNPERLWKLFTHPQLLLADVPAERAAQLAAHEGTPHVRFDAVVVDESQILANARSQRSQLVHRLTHPERGKSPFVLPVSATPFSRLSETSYAADLIAWAAGVKPPVERTGPEYLDWLATVRLTDEDGTQRGLGDVDTVKELLYRRGVGSSVAAEDLGLPAQERTLHPIELTGAERAHYERAWAEFLRLYNPDAAEDQPFANAGSEALQRVMQASLLKVPQVTAHVVRLVKEGHQVIVPAWYQRTVQALAGRISRELRRQGLPDKVVQITGLEPQWREARRIAFQTGRALVAVTNVVEGINLHAGEANTDGKGAGATMAPRRTVIADVLTGGKKLVQVEGRGQRDGQSAPVDYLFVRGTKEQEWLSRSLHAAADTQHLSHALADSEALQRLHAELDDDLEAQGQAATPAEGESL